MPSVVIAQNQVIVDADDDTDINDIDYDGDDYVILDNPIGSGGECRRDYHCFGRERCVLRRRKYM